MEDKIRQFRGMLLSSPKTVFFGGAGVSTESGIPDFRSVDGLYSQEWKYPPETIISHDFFMHDTEEFYRFYRKKLLYPDVLPNDAHKALAELESKGLLYGIITQNIDGLHQVAGSKNVAELHGTVLKNHCMRCGKAYDMNYIRTADGIPRCVCGGTVKPDVTLYGESLPEDAIGSAVNMCAGAKLMIVAGTSLTVYPAASFVSGFAGKLVLINKTPTPFDSYCDLVFYDSVGSVLKSLVRALDEP